jgi:hypothetical protein
MFSSDVSLRASEAHVHLVVDAQQAIALPTMFRSRSFSFAAIILAGALTVSLAAAADQPSDPRIVSSAAFVFKSDRGIFSGLPDAPSDPRIFSQHGRIASAGQRGAVSRPVGAIKI